MGNTFEYELQKIYLDYENVICFVLFNNESELFILLYKFSLCDSY